MDDKVLHTLLQKSLDEANIENVENAPDLKWHKILATKWIEQLARGFSDSYQNETDVCVFSRPFASSPIFGLNEFLYDISVCRLSPIPHELDGLFFVQQTLWGVESELSDKRKQIVKDFNKLVLSTADNKLFIGSQRYDGEDIRKILSYPAKQCNGNVYFALIPHPKNWHKSTLLVELWKLGIDSWTKISKRAVYRKLRKQNE